MTLDHGSSPLTEIYCKKGERWEVWPGRLRLLQEQYADLDVQTEILKAADWTLHASEGRRPKRASVVRFLLNWLSNARKYRERDNAGSAGTDVGLAGRVAAPDGKYEGVGQTISTAEAAPPAAQPPPAAQTETG